MEEGLALFDITRKNHLPYNRIDKCREKRVVAKHAEMSRPVEQHWDANLELNKTRFNIYVETESTKK